MSNDWRQTHLGRLLGHAMRRFDERVLALMPAAQGALEWPQGGPSLTALVFDEQLPLADSSIDRMLMVHLLEH